MYIWGRVGPRVGSGQSFCRQARVGLVQGFAGSGQVQEKWPMDNSEPLPNTETYEQIIFSQKIALINHCTDVGKR